MMRPPIKTCALLGILTLSSFLSSLTGCGVKGPPVPPDAEPLEEPDEPIEEIYREYNIPIPDKYLEAKEKRRLLREEQKRRRLQAFPAGTVQS